MKTSVKTHVLAVGFYLLATVIFSLPVGLHLTDQVVGAGGDPWQTMWRFSHYEQQVVSSKQQGMLLQLVRETFGGAGDSRLVNLSAWPWMWLQVIAGQPLTYNLVWLGSFTLAGYAMFLLAQYLLKRHWDQIKEKEEIRNTPARQIKVAAFLAGFYYMLLPFHVAHAQGHFGAMQLAWLPLAILLIFKILDKPTWGRGLGLAIVVIIQAWTEHHYALWLAVFALILAVWRWRKVIDIMRGKRSVVIWVMAVVIGLGIIVPYWPTVRLVGSGDSVLNLGTDQTVRFSADVFSYLVPAPFQTLWGKYAQMLFSQRFTGNFTESTLFLGWVPLLLILFFSQRVPRQQRVFWLVVAGFFGLISLGPLLHVMGTVTRIPLPYALIDSWPIFSSVRAVARAGVMVEISVAVLLGWVVATQVNRKSMVFALAGVIMLEFMFWPMPMQSARLSQVYRRVSELPGKSVIEIPAATNYTTASRALYASEIHGKKVVGSIALERAEGDSDNAEIRSLPALRQLLYLRTTHVERQSDDFFGQVLAETLPDVLRYLDVGAIVINKDSLSDNQLTVVRQFLEREMKMQAEDFGDVVLYLAEIDKLPAGDGVFLSRDSRWANVGYDSKRDSIFAEIPNEAEVALYNVRGENVQVGLRFDIAPESQGNILVKSADKMVTDLHLQGGEEAKIRMTLPLGKTTLTFINRGSGKVVIQNPLLEVAGVGVEIN
ncbi:MAG: hypothetical protein U1C49_01075 [Candidatus Andersenbacteria bacterium]|nr:hypothetical protein [bacterium]MDZ4225419.1 hypothetical protein [Candidatus Andersenbacteria bacterium]